VRTLYIQTQIKLQQTQLSRLKDAILSRTEAISRTVHQKATEQAQSATGHKSTIDQLKHSIKGAENTLSRLQDELTEAEMDDRTAFYREQEEELKATYLVYETIGQDVLREKREAERWDARLKEVDQVASPENLKELRLQVEEARTVNRSLRDKWDAYQRKMRRMRIESQIARNRGEERPIRATLKEIKSESQQVLDALQQLDDEMEAEQQQYKQNVARLTTIIDDQRRKIVAHLTGHDGQPPLSVDGSE
jgi:chromosome segregation ATPase